MYAMLPTLKEVLSCGPVINIDINYLILFRNENIAVYYFYMSSMTFLIESSFMVLVTCKFNQFEILMFIIRAVIGLTIMRIL